MGYHNIKLRALPSMTHRHLSYSNPNTTLSTKGIVQTGSIMIVEISTLLLIFPLQPPLPPPLSSQLRRPHTHKQVLTLILILAIELDLLFFAYVWHLNRWPRTPPPPTSTGSGYSLLVFTFPTSASADTSCFEDEFPDFVSLAFFFGRDVFPA